jgi:hypothetical protein
VWGELRWGEVWIAEKYFREAATGHVRTQKNPRCGGWQISWGRLLLNNLLDSISPLQLCLAISVSQTHATSYSFFRTLLCSVKEKGGKPDRKPYPLLYGLTQKRFIYRLLTRHGCLPVWLVAAWYSSGSGHGPTWTSRTEVGVLKKLSLAGIAKLSRLKYRWLRFVWPEPTIGWCTQPANSQLILQSSMKYLGLAGLA